MTTTPFDTEDFNSAADESSVNDDKELRTAFGRASNAVRTLVLNTGNDNTMPHAEKVLRLDNIATNATMLASPQRRDEQPAAVGGSRSEASRSCDEDSDTVSTNSKASARVTELEAALDKLVADVKKATGVTLTTTDHVPNGSVADVIKEATDKAKQEGKDEATSSVPQDLQQFKADNASSVQDLTDAWQAGHVSNVPGVKDWVVPSGQVAKLIAGLDKLGLAFGVTPKHKATPTS